MRKVQDIIIDPTHHGADLADGGGLCWSAGSSTVTMERPEPAPLPMDAKLNVLIIGGSGFVGTAVANEAVRRGFRVTVVSRGKMPLPNGVEHLKADRKNPGELGYALCKTQATFDLVVDCIASHPDDIQQDIKLFS